MSCIAGLIAGKRTYLAGDSRAMSALDHESLAIKDEKVFMVKGMLVGVVGSMRAMQVLRYKVPEILEPLGKTAQCPEYFATTFADAIRTAFMSAGSMAKNDDNTDGIFLECLIGVRGRLFVMQSDYAVFEPAIDFWAIGSGSGEARGVLWVTQDSDAKPEERLVWALEAASQFNAGVGAPFVVEYV